MKFDRRFMCLSKSMVIDLRVRSEAVLAIYCFRY